MKRVIAILGLSVFVFFAGRALYRSLAGDETRIRWLVREEVEAFNEGDLSGCMEGFATGYRDTTADLDRTGLQRALGYVFQSRRDPGSGELSYRLAVPEDGVEVALRGDAADTADVTFPVTLSEKGQAVWEVRVEAELVRRDGDWQFSSSRHETILGARPGR